MEPTALANLNGTLVPFATPSSSSSRAVSWSASPAKGHVTMNANSAGTPLTSKARRRDSVQWVRSSPASSTSSPDHVDINQNQRTLGQEDFLSPVPATPAPESITQYAYGEDGLYGTNGYGDVDTPSAEQTPYFLRREELIQMTAPVRRFAGGNDHNDTDEDTAVERKEKNWMGLNDKKDESVMYRLMAARRKSLQFAPKVGSPLARRF